jgi:hypothetical protein
MRRIEGERHLDGVDVGGVESGQISQLLELLLDGNGGRQHARVLFQGGVLLVNVGHDHCHLVATWRKNNEKGAKGHQGQHLYIKGVAYAREARGPVLALAAWIKLPSLAMSA